VNSHAALEQDAHARREALDVRRSMLLQAPAGSGKTTVLTARYLALLAVVDKPEAILAITFTRKAAAEMRHRVLEALTAASAGKQVTGIASSVLHAARHRDVQCGWDLLRNPSRLRIDTIDALNYRLASQLPIAARSSPGLRIAADASALYRRAARRCLSRAESEPEIAEAANLVFERLDNSWQILEDRLTEMLQERSHWLPRVLAARGDELVERVEVSLVATLRTELAVAMAALSADLLRESEAILTHSLRARGLLLPGEGVRLTGDPACIAQWRELSTLALTKNGWRKSFTIKDGFDANDKLMKARAEQWIELLAAHPEIQAALQPLGELPDHQLAAVDREALAALATLLVRAAAELQLVFAASGQVDFSYVSAAARAALTEQSEPTDLALRTGTALGHILVDEFQDTSFEQLELLGALTAGWEPGDGRTLFVVGDPMQSIYQFREAEVGLFLRARDHGLGTLVLESLRLRQNFRSRAALIDWVNEHFACLFPGRDDARLAAIGYLPSTPGPAQILHEGPAVTLHAFRADDIAAEAAAVVQIVQAARAQDADASIGILVSARPHAVRLVAALCAAGFTVRGVDLQPLNERPVVRDLAALTRALLHGADRSAWLALLRSPWCGLTLMELQELHFDEHGDLFALLQSQLHKLTGLAQASWSAPGQRLRRLCAALEPAISGTERGLPLWQRVDRCWLRLGGPSVYVSGVDRLDARQFIDALAEHEDPDALAGEGIVAITKRLYSSSTPQTGAVDVMTMHAAKGLEWDIVILPSLGRRTRAPPDRLMHWIELPRASSGTDLLLAPIRATDKEPHASLAGYIKRLRRERIALERVRLLYVASTRARKALHLMGGLKAAESKAPLPLTGSLLCVLWPAIGGQFSRLYAALGVDQSADNASEPASLRRLPAHWSVPVPPDAAPVRRLSLTAPISIEAPEYSWVGLTARAVGTVVHAELRRLADKNCGADSTEPDYLAWLSELGVGSTELASATARIREALKRTLSDERGRWLLSNAHRESHSEWRLTGLHEGRVVNVIFDRMLVDSDGRRWIIDYKTSSHEGGAVQEFIDREAERYRPQMQRYANLAAQMDQSAVRIALYFPLLGIFRELAP
jgi:ATP-dependent helicase/nuclease subunit A